MLQNAFSLSSEQTVTSLQTDINKGLGLQEVKKRLARYGKNMLPKHFKKSKLAVLRKQFINPIVYILAIAAVLAFIVGEWAEASAVCIVMAITILIGFFMELSAIRSLESLRQIGESECTVLRSGKNQIVPVTQVVPGDILFIERGDVVAADARLITVENLKVKEAMLTGESVPVKKNTKILDKNSMVTDQQNMVFKGTIVTKGQGAAVVTATGTHTLLGKIQALGSETEKETTPLEKKLNLLSRWLIWLMLAFVIVIVSSGYLGGKDLMVMIETGIALAVAAIPEGLPVVATIALARGMLRLSKKQVVIKHLEAVETLGSTTLIGTDKTGTLTEDNMTVHTIAFEGEVHQQLHLSDQKLNGDIVNQNAMEQLILTSTLCNDVKLASGKLRGDSIDLGLLRFVERIGQNPSSIREKSPKLYEVPFDEDLKLMATVNRTESNGYAVYVKGAFENVVSCCSKKLYQNEIKDFHNHYEWEKTVENLSAQGFRVLAMAYKEQENIPQRKELLTDLVFIGIVCFIDPARKDVNDIINIYKKAGVKVVMMTGDHPKTAQKIAMDIGLLGSAEKTSSLLEGSVFDQLDMDSDEVLRQLQDTKVFARVTPLQKLRLVDYYQKQNNVVGVFGDGINDVPALIKADIGIAMGIRGTEAAREAADVILKDDSFGAVELAIRQGRIIYQHIRQFVVYLLSCNFAEIITVGVAALLNLPAPLLPLQILFLNLVTDVFPALALGFGKGEQDVMDQPPRKYDEPIMTSQLWVSTLIYGFSITCAVLGITVFSQYRLGLPPESINNLAFYTLIIAQLLNVFNMPKRHLSFFNNEVIKNPWVWGALLICVLITWAAILIPTAAKALSLVPLQWQELRWSILFGFSALLIAQLFKRLGITT